MRERLARWFGRAEDRLREKTAAPWATFEVNGIDSTGRVAVAFNWNQAFIKRLNELGFQAETPEETVQLFFFAAGLRPEAMAQDPLDEPVQPTAHPQLSAIQNEVRV